MELYRNQPTRESQFPYLALKRKSTVWAGTELALLFCKLSEEGLQL